MKILLLLAAAGAALASSRLIPTAPTGPQPAGQDSAKTIIPEKAAYRVLVYSRTAGFRHDSIPDGIAAIKKMGNEHGFGVDATEDPAQFTPSNLDQYAAVVFLCTTMNVLDDEQQTAFEGYIASGHGYVGIHSAADTEYDWPWYGQLVGAYFKSHPAISEAAIRVEDRTHPSTRHLPEEWKHTDEWYDYRDNPRDKVHVLMSLDEKTYQGGTMPDDHPIAWCHEFRGGRSWYTGLGHTKESYTDPRFVQHMLGGIQWAAGKVEWTRAADDKTAPATADN